MPYLNPNSNKRSLPGTVTPPRQPSGVPHQTTCQPSAGSLIAKGDTACKTSELCVAAAAAAAAAAASAAVRQ